MPHCQAQSLLDKLLHQAAQSHPSGHHRSGWHCWHPAPSFKAPGKVMLFSKMKQAALGLFASLAAHCHALLAAAHLSELMGTKEA